MTKSGTNASDDANHLLTLRFLAEPGSVNFGGKVHGGAVMKWIDEAGYACAVRWSGRYCVTVYVGGIRFFKPIHVGNLVELRARLVMTGRSSLHILVDVHAGDVRTGQWVQTTRCLIVFSAIDDNGKTVEVPAWVPGNDEERALEDYARKLKELREQLEDSISLPLS